MVLPLVVGCPTEVPYEEVASNTPADTAGEAGEEAPPWSPADNAGEGSAAKEDSAPESAEVVAATDPETPEEATSDPAGATLPWASNGSADGASAEANRYFSGVGASSDAAEDETPTDTALDESEEAEDTSDGFGGFLDDAYADLIDNDDPTPAEEPAETPAPEQATPPPGSASKPVDLWKDFTPPPNLAQPAETPTTVPEIDLPIDTGSRYAKPKAPTKAEPTEANTLDDLWDDPPAVEQEPPADEPRYEEPPPAGGSVRLPWDDEPAPTPADPEPVAEPVVEPRYEQPPPVVEETVEPRYEEPAEPEESFLPAEPTPVRRPPMAAAVIEPLPAVPVLPFNTRHLAWLLGGKLGLAELADLDGATPSEVAGWTSEVGRLTKELGVDPPRSARPASAETIARVRALMDLAAEVGDAVADEHGSDHAALVEISLKTNALLVLAETRPDLSPIVAEAVEAAADRALLPRFLWEDAAKTLAGSPTTDEALDAVTRLHERVESYLR